MVAVFENIISCGMDVTHKRRRQVAAANIGIMILLSLPCVLGYNIWSGFMPFGEGSAVLDLKDGVGRYREIQMNPQLLTGDRLSDWRACRLFLFRIFWKTLCIFEYVFLQVSACPRFRTKIKPFSFWVSRGILI